VFRPIRNTQCTQCIFCGKRLFFATESTAAADSESPGEERTPHHASDDNVHGNDANNTAAVILPENGAAVRFLPDGDADRNGPTVVPTTSVDAIIRQKTTDKDKVEKKDKKEKPKLVGWFELVRSILIHLLKVNFFA